MPELPEVQTVVSSVRPHLLGRRITAVNLTRQDIVDPPASDLPTLLVGRLFKNVERRGKRIIMTLDDGNRFYIHLGMTGRLTMEEPSAPVLPHTHLRIECEVNSDCGMGGPPMSSAEKRESEKKHGRAARATGATQLRFSDPRRFGGIWWLEKADGDEGMGPEPLSMTPKQLALRLSRTSRAIKSALLDQSLVAGLGNIYVDESLFTAGIHPLIPGNKLATDQIARLNRAIKSVLRKAINHRGSTLRDYRDANGEEGAFQKLHCVYGREAQPCRKCKTSIERIVLGGRSTHFCPRCQKR